MALSIARIGNQRAPARPQRLRARPVAGLASLGQLRVLLVEDNPIEAMRVCQLLSRTRAVDARVESAQTLAVAIERLSLGGVDVVVLDLNLPDSEGIDTFTGLSCAAPHLPIVVLSAHAEEILGVQAVQLGAEDYLIKGHLSAEGLGRTLRCAVERHRLVAALRGLSLSDELTGLLNRRGFGTLANGHLRLGSRAGSRFLLFFMDLDGLKHINDTHGHHEGDQAIIRTAEVLRSTFRQSDVVARFSGDEFVILALDTSRDEGRTILQRLRQRLERENQAGGLPYRLTLSIGVVAFDAAQPPDLEELLVRADLALYSQKRARRISPQPGAAQGLVRD